MLIEPSPHSDGSTFKMKGLGDKSKLKTPDSIVSSSSSFFPCVCANRGSDLCFRVFRRARSQKCEASRGATDTRDGGPGRRSTPASCLSSLARKSEKITSVIRAKLKPVTETSPSGLPSHFLGTRLRDPQVWYQLGCVTLRLNAILVDPPFGK